MPKKPLKKVFTRSEIDGAAIDRSMPPVTLTFKVIILVLFVSSIEDEGLEPVLW